MKVAPANMLPTAPMPNLSDEHDRLDCVRALKIIEAPELEGCASLIECVAGYFRVPVAFFSVIDEKRQYFKTSVGLALEGSSRDDSFCKHTIQQRSIYAVADATRDPLYANNPFVWSSPFIKFYAGAPVVIDRIHAIGSLCIVDHRPRVIDDEQKRMLRHFSVMLAGLIEIQHLDRERIQLARSRDGEPTNG